MWKGQDSHNAWKKLHEINDYIIKVSSITYIGNKPDRSLNNKYKHAIFILDIGSIQGYLVLRNKLSLTSQWKKFNLLNVDPSPALRSSNTKSKNVIKYQFLRRILLLLIQISIHPKCAL